MKLILICYGNSSDYQGRVRGRPVGIIKQIDRVVGTNVKSGKSPTQTQRLRKADWLSTTETADKRKLLSQKIRELKFYPYAEAEKRLNGDRS